MSSSSYKLEGGKEGVHHMGACREMRLPRSESESQSMSPFSGALDSLAADAAAPAPKLI